MDYQQELDLFQRGTDTLRSIYKCHICLHDFSGYIVENIKELPVNHINPFCSIPKGRKRGKNSEEQCVQFDQGAVHRRLSRKAEPFWKVCPFGIIEAIIPVFLDNRNIGVLFIGPFKSDNLGKLPKGSLVATNRSKDLKISKASKSLPGLEVEDLKHLLTLGEFLAVQLERIILKATGANHDVKDRKRQIEDFFDENFHRNVGLADLAAKLCLSESRTYQLLKEYFELGFSDMLIERRLQQAAKILRMSMFSISKVSSMTGFRHSEYFSRVFRRRFGMSPRDYRNSEK